MKGSFDAMGQLPGAGVALGVLLVVGLGLAWGRLDRDGLRAQAAAPAALLIGAFVFVVMTGWKEVVQFGPDYARGSRYLYFFVAMALPAMAVAIDAIVRRWQLLMPAALAVFVIGMPGNVEILASPPGTWSPAFQTSYRQFLLSLPSSPVAHAVPRSARPDPYQGYIFAPQVSIGWLLDQKAAGRLPDPGPVDTSTKADATVHLALQQRWSHLATSPTTASSSVPLVLATKSPSLGTILVDTKGMTLYTLYAGIRSIPCTGTCQSSWAPLLAPPGRVIPTGGPGVTGLGKTASGNVTYWGYPLFRYAGDKAPGEVNGNKIMMLGGAWHIIRLDAPKTCSALVKPVAVDLQKGQSIGIQGGSIGIIYNGSTGPSDLMKYNPAKGNTLLAMTGPLSVEIQPIKASDHVTLCR